MYFGEYFIRMHKSRKWFYHLILDWLALCKCMLDCFRNLNCGMLIDINFNDHNNFLSFTVYEMMSHKQDITKSNVYHQGQIFIADQQETKQNLLNLSLLVNYVFSIKCSLNICFYFSSFTRCLWNYR